MKESAQSLKPKLVKPSSNSKSVFFTDNRKKEGLAVEKDVKKDPSKNNSFKTAFPEYHSSKRSSLGDEPQVVNNVCKMYELSIKLVMPYVMISFTTLLTTCLLVLFFLLSLFL